MNSLPTIKQRPCIEYSFTVMAPPPKHINTSLQELIANMEIYTDTAFTQDQLSAIGHEWLNVISDALPSEVEFDLATNSTYTVEIHSRAGRPAYE